MCKPSGNPHELLGGSLRSPCVLRSAFPVEQTFDRVLPSVFLPAVFPRSGRRQTGRSGLGLDAQKHAVHQRLDGGRWQLVAEFVEIELRKRAKRPQLDAALTVCKKQKAKLVVAKLDLAA